MVRWLSHDAHGRVRPLWAKWMLRLYGPFLGAGVRIVTLADDYSHIRVEMPLTWYNANYVGTQFGGALYAMTDPFYMLMLIQILGHEYIVWDKAASIEFIKPGRSRVCADFNFTPADIDVILAQTASGEKYVFDKEVTIHDTAGELVARVTKTIYVRKKPAR